MHSFTIFVVVVIVVCLVGNVSFAGTYFFFFFCVSYNETGTVKHIRSADSK